MVGSRNQSAVNHVLSYMEKMSFEDVDVSIFDRLANLPCGPKYRESVLDRALGFLRVQYDEERDSDWAVALNPWECRLLNHTTGAAFTKIFCTELFIPFDGCYEDARDVGRLEDFLTTFSGLAARAASGQPVRGSINPWYIKELVFYQDPLFSSTDPGSLRDQSRSKSVWHYLKRIDEDKKAGLLPTVTPKRMKAYTKICSEGHLEEMEVMFTHDPNKICLMWIRIIDLFRYLPNLEGFKWRSNARVVEPFLSAISHYCKKLKVLEMDLHNSFDTYEYMLNAWNRFYLNKETGKLYQTHQILNEPVAKYLCEYISRDPKDRAPEELPTQCHIRLKLAIKMDYEVPTIVHTIGQYTRHVQSLVIDRSKSHSFLKENRKTESGEVYELAWNYLRIGVTHLSLIGTDASMHNYLMNAIIPASIESLEIKDGQSLDSVYFGIVAGQNRLRKFKVSFPPPDEAKERAYKYWRHYVFQKRLTLDFLRSGAIRLDELDIRGDFGEPTLNPVEFSGLSTDLFFAIEAQAGSLVRLQVVNNNIDFTLAEIGSIIIQAKNLTQLGVTCRAFKYQDRHGNWIEQGLGTHRNFERLLGLLGGNGNPFSLTILRTHYNALDEVVYDRDGADRVITSTRSFLEFEAIAKKMVERGLPLAHLAIFAEGKTNAYGIFGAEWDEYLFAFELRDAMLQQDVDGVFETYKEFEEVNKEWIESFGVGMPKPVGGPPIRG
ncbi:hypothetical protein V502_06081 [Pseudogymnoascus sp. VKM F-4520 (FW-2644)]|nr:hypothetical protein V502_06081 [Pseudogymnoascus sp. VKM F-4520 (FW-2644)]